MRSVAAAFDSALLVVQPRRGQVPWFLTLTTDRKPWVERCQGDEKEAAFAALRFMSRKVAHAMRRLGVRWWTSAREFQSATGSGWVHFHVIALFPDTLKREHVTRLVGARWGGILGGGFVRATRVYSKDGSWEPVAKYLAKYSAKGSEHFPPVLDDPRVLQAPRLISSSKAVRQEIRARGQVAPRVCDRKRGRPARKLDALAVRLARSGLRVRERRWAERVGPAVEPRERFTAQHGRRYDMPTRAVERLHAAGLLKLGMSFSAAVYGHAPRLVYVVERPLAVGRWLCDHAEEVAAWSAEELQQRRARLCDGWHRHQLERQTPARFVPPRLRQRVPATSDQ